MTILTLDHVSALMKRAGNGLVIDIQVSPGALRSGIKAINTWRNRLEVSVRAKPKRGDANREVVGLLADLFRVPPGAISIISGDTSSKKTVRVDNKGLEEAVLDMGKALGIEVG